MKRIVGAILFWNCDDTYSWEDCHECEGSDSWEDKDDVLGFVNSHIGGILPADLYYAADNPMGYSGRIHNDKGEVYLFQKDALVAMFWQEEEIAFSGFQEPFESLNKLFNGDDDIEAKSELAEKLDSLSNSDQTKVLAILKVRDYSRAEYLLSDLNHLDEYEINPDIYDDESLGAHLVFEHNFLDVPENLKTLMNFRLIGQDFRLTGKAHYTSYGCLFVPRRY